MPKTLTRIVALVVTLALAANPLLANLVSAQHHHQYPYSTVSTVIQSRFHMEALAHPSRVFERSAANQRHFINPTLGSLVGGGLGGQTWVEENAPELHGKNILEVTAEMALTPELFDLIDKKLAAGQVDPRAAMRHKRHAAMASSVGGIGPLLRERLVAQAALGANAIGVSLLYSHVWVQVKAPVRTVDGWTRYKLEKRKVEIGSLLREVLKPAGEIRLQMYDGTETYVKVWMAPPGTYGKGTMYFLDPVGLADVIDGRADVAYPGLEDAAQAKEEARLVQQWVLGRGALALSRFADHKPGVIVMSETAAMMAHPTLFQDGLSQDPFFKDAITVFNDHTPQDYAHPLWDEDTLQKVHVDPQATQDPGFWVVKRKEEIAHRYVDMTALMVNQSRGVFGVAQKHADVMRHMAGLERFAEKIRHVTNGVSRHYWPSKNMQKADNETLEERLQGFLGRSNEELCQWKDSERLAGLQWLAEREGLGTDWVDRVTKMKDLRLLVWDRRQLKYKRLERLPQMLRNEGMRERFINSNTVIVFGGRMHPDDDYGEKQFEAIQELLEQYPELHDRLIFFENYNVYEAPRLFQMADGSLMLSDKGQEASATGFQKAQLSGGVILAVDDGAVPESVRYYGETDKPNGFRIPYRREIDEKSREYYAPTEEGLCAAIEKFAEVLSDREERGQMIRNALEASPKVGVDRTAKDQLLLLKDLAQEADTEQRAESEGEALAKAAIRQSPLSPHQARVVLDHLNRPGLDPFVWKYQHDKELFRGGGGLHQFIKDFEHLAALGTLGDWSLAFHADKQGGGSDLRAHIRPLLIGIEGVFPALPEHLRAIDDAIRQGDVKTRIYHQHVVMAYLRQIEEELGALAANDEASMHESSTDSIPFTTRIEKAVDNGAGTVLEFEAVPARLFANESVRVQAEVDLRNLTGKDMRADLLVGRRSHPSQWSEMKWIYLGQGRYRVIGEQPLNEAGTYRYTVRICPREESLWKRGQGLDKATRSTQSDQRIYVDDRAGASLSPRLEGGRILQIHAQAYGARRNKEGKAVPGTAAHLLGQLPRILRQPFSDLYLYCLLPTGQLVDDLAKNIRRFTSGTPFFALDEDPARLSRRWFVFQPATDGYQDLIGSPYAFSNPMGISPAWGTNEQFDAIKDILKTHGKGLYMDYTANQTGLDDPWLLHGENWKATVHIDLAEVIPEEAREAFKNLEDKDFYDVKTLNEKLGGKVVQRLHEEFAKRNLGLGEGLQYCIFYKTPGDSTSRIIIAHARDPNQTPWIDTVQLDLAKPEARERVFQNARFWVDRGVNLRIDMADLSIRDAFMKQWRKEEYTTEKQVLDTRWGYPGDFWNEFSEKVMAPCPEFRVILEAYRDLPYLNDFARAHNTPGQRPRIAVYEKSPYDNFARMDSRKIRDTLAGLPDRHSVIFSQNSDDSAPWTKGLVYIKLMVALLAFAGGELLVHYRQLRGEPKMPIKQILPTESPSFSNAVAEVIEEFHMDMLNLHGRPIVQGAFKDVINNGNQNLLAMTRELDGRRLLLVANLTSNPQAELEKDTIPLPESWLPRDGERLVFEEKYYREDQPSRALGFNRSAPVYIRNREDLTQDGRQGLHVELLPGQVHIFSVYPEPILYTQSLQIPNRLQDFHNRWRLASAS